MKNQTEISNKSIARHTPGPWKIKESANGGAIVERAKNLSNQILPIEDAFLIAAAPELLEALKTCSNALASLGGKAGEYEVKKAKQAIAKAEDR